MVFSQKSDVKGQQETGVITCTDFHITKPLTELAKEHPYIPKGQDKLERYIESFDRKYRSPQKFVHTADEDPVLYGNDPASIQTKMGTNSNGAKAPIKNWPGQAGSGFRPFDPSGAAGPNHYIQAINGTPFRIFNKSTGANMLTANIGSLWSPATPDDGDPIVMYDKYADRWFISQFGQTGNKIYIAISTTNDPTGSYYTYSFTSPEFPDYLKFGIWADGYYMTSNQATDKVFCFERDQMLAGNPSARSIYKTFTTGATSSFFVPLPADADGGLPTLGTPCPFFSYSDNAWGTGAVDGVKIWDMAVTWGATPAATITLKTTVPTAAFDASFDPNWNDVSQLGSTQKLDGIGGIPTFRAQWRKWNGYNSVVLNWGVKLSATQRSIKWVELRQNTSTGNWSLYQEGTYTPDAATRWIGSIAMDDNGSIGLAYCKAGTTYPSLCYTGRLATDPLGQMTVTEIVAAAGTGAETSGNRYGDYSQLSLDPDGITFWHTGEYTLNTGTVTRVYSFQLPQPVTNTSPVASFAASSTAPCLGSTVTLSDQSTNTPTSWSWAITPNTFTYTGGTSSTSQNPQVIFNGAGPYTVALTATNAYGNNTSTQTSYITPISGTSLPITENFEGATFPPTGWTVVNADAPSIAWGTAGNKGLERRTATGNTGSTSGCVGIEFFNYADSSQVDNLISMPVSLSGATSPKLTFKRAYKYYNSSTAPTKYHDELKIYVSTDCGSTWSSALYFKKGAQLATNGTINTTFSPSVAADWDIDTVDLSAYVGQTVKVKFELGNRYGNNFYFDDINIASSVAVTASVAITSSDADNTICSGQSVTFTATPTNGGTAPSYQWKLNGVNIVGATASTYTTTSLATGSSITCVLTSNLGGVLGSPSTSNAIVTTVNATPATPTVTSNSPVCVGSTINLTTPTVTGATFVWSGPSFGNSAQNPSIANATTGMAGTYNLIVTVDGCSSTAGSTNVAVNSSVTPTVSIAITSGGNPTCASQSVTYTATATNGGTAPGYQWKLNGVNIPGATASTYTPSSIANNDVFTCVLTSNSACASPSSVTSTGITMQVTTTVTPSVSISATNTTICSGSSVTFTAAPTNGGTSPGYQWKLNNVNINGATNSTFTSTSLTNNDVISCVLTSNSSCASPSTGTSNQITMVVTNSVTPSVTSAVTSGTNPTCAGSSVTFTATPTNGGTSPSYQWMVGGVPSGTGSTFTSSSLTNGATVSCVLTSNATCVSSSTANSNVITMQITNAVTPTISISAPNTTICSGASVTFTATSSNGGTLPGYQWKLNNVNINGATSSTYTSTSLNNNDVISCVLTSNASCVTSSTANSNNLTITVSSPVTPVINVAITSGQNPLCAGSTIQYTASSSNGGTSPVYQWKLNGVNVGTNSTIYSTSSLVNGDVVTCELTSNAGCVTTNTILSSPIAMTVNPIPATPTVTYANGVLTSSASSGNQWYLNGVAIVGAIDQTLTPTLNGNYTVVVTNPCTSNPSSVTAVGNVSIDELFITGNHFSIYPNPTNGKFTVVFTSTEMNKFKLVLHNALGQVVYEEDVKDFNGYYTKDFDVTEYGKGEYYLSISNSKRNKLEKVIVY